jgi:TRAP-type C4-dicarboxylate transport system permease small subunit
MQRPLALFEATVGVLCRIAQGLAALSCLACFALVCYGVAARYFVGRPQAWVDELVGWLVAATVMLAAAEAQRRGENIGVDFLIERWTGAKRNAVLGMGAVCVAVVAAMLLVEGIETVTFTRMLGITSNVLPDWPYWAVQALVPVGGALLLLVALLQIARWATRRDPIGAEPKHASGLE